MRHKKHFTKGSEFENVVHWVQSIVKCETREIIGTHNLDPPDFSYELSNGYVISIHKKDDGSKLLTNA